MNFITKEILRTSKEIKEEAKAQLQGNWKPVIIIFLIPLFLSLFFSVRTIFSLYNENTWLNTLEFGVNILSSFLTIGIYYTLLDFVRIHDSSISPINDVFQAFKKKYFRNLLLLELNISIRIFLWSLLLFIPGIIKIFAYSQAALIYKDIVDRTGEQPSPKFCIQESERLMKGHKMEYFRLIFSFIGWILLTILSFGVGAIWLNPYISMSSVIFYENLADNQFLI